MNETADAIRAVTARMQQAIDAGQRSRRIDADDVIDVLLAIADELDPPLAELVGEADGCPNCAERRTDRLVWNDDEVVRCQACGKTYRPGS